MGRTFDASADEPGKNHVVILSYRIWAHYFAQDPNILGRRITLNSADFTVIGVMPAGFDFPGISFAGAANTDVWAPLSLYTLNPPGWQNRNQRVFTVIARLKPATTLAKAQSEMTVIASRLARQFPATNSGWSAKATPLKDAIVGDSRMLLLVLWAAVFFTLLIACANVANLLLARSTKRERETAIRCALGARRKQLVAQTLTENILLAAAGGAVGLLLAQWAITILIRYTPESIPRRAGTRIDAPVLLFTLVLSIATGLIFGVFPALRISKPQSADSLKEAETGMPAALRPGYSGLW